MCILMDNLGVHRSKFTAKVLEQQRMSSIFIPAYSPFANAIEECFSVAKRALKKERLNNIVNGRNILNEDMVERAF